MKKQVVDPTYAKSEDYKKVIETIEDEAKCPFCPDNFKYHKNSVLKKEGSWFITENSWPYENSQYHFILINEIHKEKFQELTDEDFQSVRKLLNWAISEYKIKGGGITLRFGETRFTGATVCHLHFHLIVPQIDEKTQRAKVVNFPIG